MNFESDVALAAANTRTQYDFLFVDKIAGICQFVYCLSQQRLQLYVHLF